MHFSFVFIHNYPKNEDDLFFFGFLMILLFPLGDILFVYFRLLLFIMWVLEMD
jgi:hypothetical protein